MIRLYLLNALIVPFTGTTAEFKLEKVTTTSAKEIFYIRKLRGCEIVSALGHEGSVQAFKVIIGDEPEIKLNRVQVFFEQDDEALALVLKNRIPEGVILNFEEMNKIGFDIFYIKRLK
ncbi:MAG: DUF1874 domain-containing protein [Candidatus Aenigmatarchaeota archaeon]